MMGRCEGKGTSEGVWELLGTSGIEVVYGEGVESFVIGVMAGVTYGGCGGGAICEETAEMERGEVIGIRGKGEGT